MSAAIRRIASALAVVLCVAAAGCESMGKGEQTRREEKLAKQARRERNRAERERLRDRDTAPDQVIGRNRDRRPVDDERASRGLDDVPATASRVDEGDGPRRTYSPTRDGTLYVYDADDQRVIFSTRVRADERFVLNPEAGRATLDGRTVLGTGLSARNRYRLYFDRSAGQ